MPTAHTEILIDAPIETIWQVMTDVRAYAQWNPFVVAIDCPDPEPRIGTDLTLHVRFGNGKQVRTIERITCLDSPMTDPQGTRRARLEYRFLGLLHAFNMVRGSRHQTLEELAPGQVRYVSHEDLTGWLSWAAPIKLVQDGFERHAAALKQRSEALTGGR